MKVEIKDRDVTVNIQTVYDVVGVLDFQRGGPENVPVIELKALTEITDEAIVIRLGEIDFGFFFIGTEPELYALDRQLGEDLLDTSIEFTTTEIPDETGLVDRIVQNDEIYTYSVKEIDETMLFVLEYTGNVNKNDM